MKKLILKIALISLILLTTVGFSAWYIIYQINLKPEKVVNSISQYFGLSQEVVYNGEEQVPVQKNGTDIEILDPNKLTYSYKLENEGAYTEGKPVNANVYNVKIVTNDARECVVKFTIKQKDIYLDQTTIELNYVANYYREWALMETELRKHIKFTDNENTELTNVNYNIDNINNGDITFSKKVNPTKGIYGSTYHVNVSLNDNNYKIVGNTNVLLKYKTCKIGNTYYTIEDALKETGDIVLVGDASSFKSYVVTSFSKILSTDTYDLVSRRILLPFDTNRNENYITAYDGAESTLTNVFSGLYIPNGITLNLKKNSTLTAGAVVTSGGAVKRKSVIMNDGVINVENGTKLLSYGFTKGNGIINVESGGEVLDVFRIVDWPGADESLGLKDANAFPVLDWAVHNITCETKVYKDGRYNAMSYVVIVSGAGKLEINNIYLIGDSNTSNCLFKPNGGSETDYIIKKATIANDDFFKDSQSTTIPNQIIMSGKYIDRSLKLTIKWMMFNYSFETSTSIAVPINYFDIILEKNSHLVFSSSSYILFNKSKIHIKEGATLEILGAAYLYSINNCELIVDGSLIGNGSISNVDETGQKANGSPIATNNAGAILTISNYNVSNCVIKTSSTTWITINGSTNGYVDSPDNISALTTGNVYMSEGTDIFYFKVGTSMKKFYVDFVVNGETYSEVHYSLGDDLIVEVDGLKKFKLRHYDFGGWYTDQNYNNPFTEHTFTTNNEKLTLYAKFVEKTYNFEYLASYGYTDGQLNYIDPVLSDKTPGFTLSDIKNGNIKITTKATYLDKYFDGWYVGLNKVDLPIIIPEFSYQMLEEYLNIVGEHESKIYLYCEFSDTVIYEINFITNHEHIKIPSITTKEDLLDLTDIDVLMDKYDDDINYQFYFEKWYFDASAIDNPDPSKEFVSNTTSISAVIKEGTTLTLYAKRENKLNVYINHRDIGASQTTKYVISGKTVDLSDFKYNDDYIIVANVYDQSGSLIDKTQTINESVTFELQYAVMVTVNIVEGDYGASVTDTSNNTELQNGVSKVLIGSTLKIHIEKSNLGGTKGRVDLSWALNTVTFDGKIWNVNEQVVINYKVA